MTLKTVVNVLSQIVPAWKWISFEACMLVHGCVAHPICSVLNTTVAFMRFIDVPTWASYLEAASDIVHDGTLPIGATPRNIDRTSV